MKKLTILEALLASALGILVLAAASYPIKNLVLQGDMDAGGNAINNLATSTNLTSAVTLDQLTQNIAAAGTNYATAAQGTVAQTALQPGTSITNITGIGSAALLNTGTTAGTVALGNDARFTLDPNLQEIANLSWGSDVQFLAGDKVLRVPSTLLSGSEVSSFSFEADSPVVTVYGTKVAQFDIGNLYDSNSTLSVDWGSRMLRDSGGNAVVDWDNKVLQDASENTVFAWHEKTLFDGIGNAVIYLAHKTLDDGISTALDWGVRMLLDASSITSIDWESRSLKTATGDDKLNWDESGGAGFMYGYWYAYAPIRTEGASFSENLTAGSWQTLYAYTGTGGHTLTIDDTDPPSGSQGYKIKNRGTGTLTITRSGADTFYTTSSVTSFALAPGASVELCKETTGTVWDVFD